MKALPKILLSALVGILAVSLVPSNDSAYAQVNIPPNANAGMIQNHHMNQLFLNRNMPWTNRPIQPEDYKPQSEIEGEPMIQFMNAEAQGSVIIKKPNGGVRIERAAPEKQPPVSSEANNHNYQTLPPLEWDTPYEGE